MTNILINQMMIKSKERNKSFNLLLGDILKDDSDLKILNCYEEDQRVVGDFKQYIETIDAPRRTIGYLGDGGPIVIIDAPKPILAVYIKRSENAQLDAQFYEQVIVAIFASLIRLEMEGRVFKTIALPVLFRKTIFSIHEEAISTLIKQSKRWLTISNTNAIRYYVHHEKDLDLWYSGFNAVLQRANFDISHKGDIQAIRQKILVEIERFSKNEAFYESTLVPLQFLLNRQELTIEPIAAFARKLIEVLGELLTNNTEQTLDDHIRELRLSNKFNQSFIQRLYLIKSFGNSAVHSQLNTAHYIKLEEQDLFILLLLIFEVLQDFPTEKIILR